MPDSTDFLKDYVQVKDRVRELFELYGQARIETTYEITREPDDKPKVICRAVVYRNPDETYPAGTGTSWMYLPGKTNFTLGSEIENAETSAVGRAIGFLGILTEKGMATANEIAGKQGEAPASSEGLVGTAEIGKAPADFELREGPDGWNLSFKLMDGRKGFKVIATGPLAFSLASVKDEVIGKRVTCYGRMGTESFPKAGTPSGKVTFNVLTLERIQTPDYLLPSAGGEGTEPGNREVAGADVGNTAPAAPDELDQLPVFAEPTAA